MTLLRVVGVVLAGVAVLLMLLLLSVVLVLAQVLLLLELTARLVVVMDLWMVVVTLVVLMLAAISKHIVTSHLFTLLFPWTRLSPSPLSPSTAIVRSQIVTISPQTHHVNTCVPTVLALVGVPRVYVYFLPVVYVSPHPYVPVPGKTAHSC